MEVVWHVRPWPATPQPERSTTQPERRTTQQITSRRASADVAPPFGSARREARSEVKASTTWLSRDAAMVYGLLSIGAVDTCQHAQQTSSGQSRTGGGMRTRATHRPLETEAARASAGVAPRVCAPPPTQCPSATTPRFHLDAREISPRSADDALMLLSDRTLEAAVLTVLGMMRCHRRW